MTKVPHAAGDEDLETMADNLRVVKASPGILAELGPRGVAQVQQFDRAKVLGQWEARLDALIRPRVGGGGWCRPAHGTTTGFGAAPSSARTDERQPTLD